MNANASSTAASARPGRLAGRSIIVTGGSSGIGCAVARMAAQEGASVTIADVNVDLGEAVAAEINQSGSVAQFVRMDATSEEDAAKSVEAAMNAFGRLDGACNAAGMVFKGEQLHNIPADYWDKVTHVNLRGVFFSIKFQVPAMLASGGGSIVNIASTAALLSFPNGAEYCATKAGVAGLTRAAALDYAGQGIRVNAILPGSTRTPMLETGMSRLEGMEEALSTRVPMGRLAEPDEMAMPVCWLLSPEASFITGVSIPVDGGLTAST